MESVDGGQTYLTEELPVLLHRDKEVICVKKQFKARVLVSMASLACLLLATFSLASAKTKYDLEGKTVSFGLHGGLVDLFNSPEMMDRRAQAEKEFNCKIQVLEIKWDGYEEAITKRVMSGDSRYDVYTALGTGYLVKLMGKRTLLPLDKYLPKEYLSNRPSIAKGLMENARYRGSVYAFVTGSPIGIDMMQYVAYNKGIFKSAGLPDPYELYTKRQWTWKTFTDLAKKLTKDTDGDGKIDRWGLDILPTMSLVLSNDGRYVRNVKGRLTFTADEKRVLEALNQMDAWQQAGIFKGWGPEAFKNRQIGMLYLEHWVLRDQLNPATGSWKVDFDFGIVPMPMGPSATGYRASLLLSNYAALPANSAKPKELIALVNALYPAESLIDATKESFKQWAPNREAYGVLLDSITKWTPATDPYFGLIADGWGNFKRGDKDWSSYLASIKQEKQALLDDMFNK